MISQLSGVMDFRQQCSTQKTPKLLRALKRTPLQSQIRPNDDRMAEFDWTTLDGAVGFNPQWSYFFKKGNEARKRVRLLNLLKVEED